MISFGQSFARLNCSHPDFPFVLIVIGRFFVLIHNLWRNHVQWPPNHNAQFDCNCTPHSDEGTHTCQIYHCVRQNKTLHFKGEWRESSPCNRSNHFMNLSKISSFVWISARVSIVVMLSFYTNKNIWLQIKRLPLAQVRLFTTQRISFLFVCLKLFSCADLTTFELRILLHN